LAANKKRKDREQHSQESSINACSLNWRKSKKIESSAVALHKWTNNTRSKWNQSNDLKISSKKSGMFSNAKQNILAVGTLEMKKV